MHKKSYPYLRHGSAFQKSWHYALLTLFPGLMPLNSLAEDLVASRFTSSMTTMYTSSEECIGTLSPGPEEYVQLITDYLNVLYPRGIVYWALPEVSQHIKDRERCIVTIQGHLLEYQQARIDYRYSYPDQLSPPALAAYNWGYSGSLNYSSPVPETPKENKSDTKSIWKGGRL